MKVLIGYSACPLTREAFERAGCEAWTCDLLPGVVTDGERAAVSQKAEADCGGHYFAVDPEDALEWEPTHWTPLPAIRSQKGDQ